jgi:hypothetical protein
MAKKTWSSKIIGMVVVITLICIISFAIDWYFPLDPVSPPETSLDEAPSFSALFDDADDKWMFLFKKNNKFYITDIYGQKDEVILDIVSVTNNLNAELIFGENISPNDRFLAVNYFTERKPSGSPIGKLLIFDLKDYSILEIPASLEGFEFDSSHRVFWLDSNVFLVKMHRFPGPDMFSEVVSFLVYDLRSLKTPKVIEFDPCYLATVKKNDSHVLLVSRECWQPDQNPLLAIDIQGIRLATSDEEEYFNNIYWDDVLWEINKLHLDWWDSNVFTLCEGCPTIKTEPVSDWAPPFDELFPHWPTVVTAGRFNYNNYFRSNIFLNDKLVRITDIELGWFLWDSDLQLFIFNEGFQDHWFLMDIYGHYRYWYEGEYIGKIPKNILNSE